MPQGTPGLVQGPEELTVGMRGMVQNTVALRDVRLARADQVVTHEFDFGRQTGVPLEPRGIIADYDPSTGALTVHQSHQTPYQMQDVLARLLGLAEHNVQVVCPDVGGAFGIKLHAYPDEIAVAAIA